MPRRRSLVGEDVVLTEWDHTAEQLPSVVQATVVIERDDGSCVVALKKAVHVRGRAQDRLVIAPRHIGYPIADAWPGRVGGLLMLLPWLKRMLAPLIAVSVATEDEDVFAVASLYPKSVYMAGPRGPG